MDTLQNWYWVKGPPREALSQKAESKRGRKVNSERVTDQYISTNETAHRIIHSPHKAWTSETAITEESHHRFPQSRPHQGPPVAQPSRYSLRLCLLPLIPRLPIARCVQLRTRATTHSPSRIVTGQPWAPGRRGGLLLKALRLSQWQEAWARAAAQIHHNLSWDLRGYGAGFSICPKGGPVLLEATSEGHIGGLLNPKRDLWVRRKKG